MLFVADTSAVWQIKCSDVVNNAVQTQVSGANICATFTPNFGLTLTQAESICKVQNFDWTQNITVQYDPSEFYARNIGGAFDFLIPGPVLLTSSMAPWPDPPPGGGYMPPAEDDPDYSYPFYYDPNSELPDYEDGTQPKECTLPVSQAGYTLTFHDAPGDYCLPGGQDINTPACGYSAEPAGSYGGYETYLAGVNADGSVMPLGIGFNWTSNYNGTTGGVAIKKTDFAADGNGTGGITITNVNEITSYQNTSSPSTTSLTGTQILSTSSGLAYSRVSKTFTGTLTIQNISNDTISGPFQIVLDSMPTGVTLVNATGSFGGWPYIAIPNATSLEPGQSVSVHIQISNPAGVLINSIPMVYSGSFN
jgi:hypothetical protein